MSQAPEKPKGPATAYLSFQNERIKILQEQNSDKKHTELMRIVSTEWKNLAADQKDKYMNQYKTAHESYLEKLKDWKAKYGGDEKEEKEEKKKNKAKKDDGSKGEKPPKGEKKEKAQKAEKGEKDEEKKKNNKKPVAEEYSQKNSKKAKDSDEGRSKTNEKQGKKGKK